MPFERQGSRTRPRRTGPPARRAALWFGTSWLGLSAVLALLGPWIAAHDPDAIDLASVLASSSAEHWLGTDGLGRDVLARLMHGARVSLSVGLLAPMCGLAIGGLMGLTAAWLKGRWDRTLMWLIDVLLAFPALILAIALAAYLGNSVITVWITLSVLSVPAFARVVRAQAMSVSERDFVTAALASGAGTWRIIRRHLLPNVLPAVSGFWFLVVALAIMAEGALSFLGLGVPAPMASWGSMIAEGREFLGERARLSLLPAAMIFLTVLACQCVAFGLATGSGAKPLSARLQ